MTLLSPRTIKPGETLRYALPPRVVWISRTPHECHVAVAESGQDSEQPGVDKSSAPDGLAWERFAIPDHFDQLGIRPALPDRPLVVRPVSALSILEGHTTRLFVSIPLWWQIECSAADSPPVRLTETPSAVLSKTWFGEPFAGEACYALKTRARHAISELDPAHNRALCELTMRNGASERLLFERFCLRTPHLTLYRDDNGRFWTNDVNVVFVGSTAPAEVVHQRTPPAHAPNAEFLGAPRKIPPKGFTSRAFDQMRSLGGML